MKFTVICGAKFHCVKSLHDSIVGIKGFVSTSQGFGNQFTTTIAAASAANNFL